MVSTPLALTSVDALPSSLAVVPLSDSGPLVETSTEPLPPSILTPLVAGDRHLAALEFELGAGRVDDDAALALDQDLAVAVQGDLGVHRVHLQLQLVAGAGQRDALGAAVLVDQVDPVAAAGHHRSPVDRAGTAVDQLRAAGRWGVDAVVQPAEHVGPADVALLEDDQHLVTDLGQHHRAAILAGAGLHGARPVADVVVRQPREGQLHPGLLLRVVGVADLGDHRALTRSGRRRRRRSARTGCVPADRSPRTTWCSRSIGS